MQPWIGYKFPSASYKVSTALVNPNDDESLAVTLNRKNRRINPRNFSIAFTTSKMYPPQQENNFRKMENQKLKWLNFIDISLLSDDCRTAFKEFWEKSFGG